MTIPTTQQAVDSAVAALESNIGQDVPTYDKSFLHSLSVVLGMNNSELYRFGAQRARMVLALTATGDDLTQLGFEYGIIRKPAEKAVIRVIVVMPPPSTGVVTRQDVMQAVDNEVFYFPIQDYPWTAANDQIYVDVRSEFAGADYDLAVGGELNFSSPPGEAFQTTYVISTVNPGADEETDDELRTRVLDEVQSVGGGSNLADYRTWGQRTPNVARIDAYTGQPPWVVSVPGERTIYVEATTSYDADGIADAALLDLVTEYIHYDPDTGRRQPCLGSTDDTVYVYSIYRSTAYIVVRGLTVDSTKYYECQTAISESCDQLVRSMRPFLLGLDSEIFRNDVLTSGFVSRDVQRVVQAYGGSFNTVDVGLAFGIWESHVLNPGERLKAQVSFV